MYHEELKDRLRKALGDPHYLSKKAMEKCRAEVNEVMQSLVPFIAEAVRSAEKYDENPCIRTGVRRAEAQEAARVAKGDVAEFLWARYDVVYSSSVPREEMERYIRESLEHLEGLDGIRLK